MKYIVQVNGRRIDVELDGDGIRLDGVAVRAHLADVPGTPVRLVTIGDEVHRVVARRGTAKGRYTLRVDGYRFEVEALDERTRTIRDLTATTATAFGPAPLVAPMPGLVVRVTVQPGDAVNAGQSLVVMEAMKMENELCAPAAGIVKAVLVQPGTAVEKGTTLVELA